MLKELKMEAIGEIEKAISNLTLEELAQFREWFEEFDADLWDRQFEEDVKTGKLHRIAEKSISDFKAGKAKEL